MTSGLDKLQEASVAVERMREELSVMEAELAVASEKAQKVDTKLHYIILLLLSFVVGY